MYNNSCKILKLVFVLFTQNKLTCTTLFHKKCLKLKKLKGKLNEKKFLAKKIKTVKIQFWNFFDLILSL